MNTEELQAVRTMTAWMVTINAKIKDLGHQVEELVRKQRRANRLLSEALTPPDSEVRK